MTNWTGIFVLVASGAVALGVLCGYLIFRFFRKIRQKREAILSNIIPSSRDPAAYQNLVDSYSANYKAVVSSELPIKLQRPGGLNDPGFVSQKQKSPIITPQKPPSPTAHQELEIVPQKENSSLSLEEKKKSPAANAITETEIVNRQPPHAGEVQNDLRKSDFIKELEKNLAIANTPWSGKVTSFQSKSWDAWHGEGDKSLTPHIQEIIQLYVDISLANNIVWMATVLDHRSNELDKSYIKLCANVAARTKSIMSILK